MESSIDIVNVVASTKLAEAFDLPKIELDLEGAEYNKKKFPGLVYRVKAPKAAFLIFIVLNPRNDTYLADRPT
jgi:transcription initiation factor TFIID TATA-box-binding protein